MTRLALLTAALLCLAADAAPGAGMAPRDPRRHVREILRRPLYRRWQRRERRSESSGEAPEWWRAFKEKLDEWAADFGRWLDRNFGGSGRTRDRDNKQGGGSGFFSSISLGAVLKFLGWAAVIALVVFLAIILYRHLAETRGARAGARVLSREQTRQALESGEALALESPQWLAEAERLAGEHDFRAVYRALYLALLSGLHAANKIDFRRNRTNWTYVERFRGSSDDRGLFASLTLLFDRVWYGLKQAEGTTLQGVRQTVKRLLGRED